MRTISLGLALLGALFGSSHCAPAPQSDESTSPPEHTDSTFTKPCRAYINDYRDKHEAPPLAWKPKLADYAYTWANKCSKKHAKPKYGETIYYLEIEDEQPDWEAYTEQAVDWWMEKEADYDPEKPTYPAKWYTQVVWESHTAVGCAWSDACATGQYYFYCEYDPMGNIAGEYEANVHGDYGGYE